MTHNLYDVWDLDESVRGYSVAAQLVNCVMYFESRAKAETYIAAVKGERKKLGLKTP